MPNWCKNRWTIHATSAAEAETIFDLMTHLPDHPSNPKVTFTKILPEPEILSRLTACGAWIDGEYCSQWFEERDEEGNPIRRRPTAAEQAEIDATGCSDWHQWRIANWGCKWNAMSIEVWIDDESIYLEFETPWCPPTHVVDALRDRFPDAHISAFYDEPGMEMAGYL